MKINILDYFDDTVIKNPLKIAVIENEKKICFLDLKKKSIQLASQINSILKNKKNVPIAVFIKKSINSIKANIAITYSGNIYMNLDINYPPQRINNIIKNVRPRVVLVDRFSVKKFKNKFNGIIILNIDNISSKKINKFSYSYKSLIDTDPYCLINTSGSTGVPKSVVLNHRNFIDFIERASDELNINNNEVIGSLSPLVFDIYSFELCMLIAKSSTIVIIPEEYSLFPVKILNLLSKKNVNFIFWVPTILVNIANMNLLKNIRLKYLKKIWFAGEVFPTKQFNYWYNKLPKATFVNLYGPIEITLDCTFFIINRKFKDSEPLPIGHKFRNTDVLILNSKNKICKPNEIGELCVRGSSVAMGYYNNWSKTSGVFVQNPLNNFYPELIYKTGDLVLKNFNGEILFRGRKDDLIKHRGYRIELKEIEHIIINNLKLVSNACVVYDNLKKNIVLFYESKKKDLSEKIIKKKFYKYIPQYMVPKEYKNVLIMKRNINGKIDRLYYNKLINKKNY